ncbi:hypothetical protein SAMN06272735_8602 [Streptomyces sp. TLI_55]|nr:hypothetical protein SAMN06272735_8602 [Streptomyces sp. TLI_55]
MGAFEAFSELAFGPADQELVVLAQGEADDFAEQIGVGGGGPVFVHPLHEAAGAEQEDFVDVGVPPAQGVDPVQGFGAGALSEVVQVKQ